MRGLKSEDLAAMIDFLYSAQWSRCQLGCSGSQNFPCIWAVATGAYYPKVEFENHKKTLFLLAA